MSPSGAEVIRQIKSQIDEVDPSEVNSAVSNGNGSRPVLIDVRESEEWDAGHIPGAKHVPRGYLESRIEGAVPDRSAARRPLLRLRQPLRARRPHAQGDARLRERRVDDRRHHAVEGPRLRRRGPEVALQGAARALLAPPARAGDRARGPDQAARGEGAAARRRRPRLADRPLPRRRRRRARWASSTTTTSTSPTCSARSSTPPTASARRRWTRAERAIHAINPDVNVVKYATRLDASNIMEIIPGYDVIVDGVDNFPTRYLLNDATVRLRHPGRLGLDPRLRRPAVGLQAARRPVLPLPVPRAAAGRAGPVLRRQRRARRAAGHDGPAAGDRGREAGHGRGRAAGRPPAALRSARRDVHRAQGPPRPGVPDLLARTRRRSPTRRWASSRTTRRSAPPRARLGIAMATIKIPPVLRPSVGGEKEVQAGGGDVGAVLHELAEQHPATQSQLFGARRVAQPLRQRLPQRRGRARARRAGHGASATATRS